MDAKYDVVLKGIGTNAEPALVMQNLGALFKCSAAQINAMLATPAYTVKSGVSQESAEKYRKAVEGAGAVCVIEPATVETENLDFDVSMTTAPATVSVAVAETPKSATKAILFQGDVDNLTKLMHIVHGDGLVTGSRCVFNWGKASFSATKDEIAKVEEQKHGLGTKLLITHRNGTQVVVQAANMRGLKAALYSLAGLPFDASFLVAPDISQVKNGTAWLAALGPLIAAMLVALWYGDRMFNFGLFSMLKLWIIKLVLIYLFIRIDHLVLQHQGFNTVELGITPPEQFWSYLFSRAKAFKHGKGYAILWSVLFGLDILGVLLAAL